MTGVIKHKEYFVLTSAYRQWTHRPIHIMREHTLSQTGDLWIRTTPALSVSTKDGVKLLSSRVDI